MSEERYEQAVGILSDALKFGIHASLEGISKMMAEMGNPHLKYPAIQVAGTNGKTSTVRQIAAILRTYGLRTGLYTSPHLVEYPERIEIDGKVVSHDLFADGVLLAKKTADMLEKRDGLQITEFELVTAACFWIFAQENIDVAVLEVGMGGRWDSTSIVDRDVAVVTGIGLDHIGILGDTVEEIAGEKAAIISKGCKAVLGPGTQQTLQVFLGRSAEVGVSPWLVRDSQTAEKMKSGEGLPSGDGLAAPAGMVSYDSSYDEEEGRIDIDVHGAFGDYPGIVMHAPLYQAQNISTAVAACEQYLGHALDPQKVRSAMADFTVPGRFEMLSEQPLLIIDAAHNPQSALNLATAIARKFPDGGFQMLLAVLADKDANGIIEAIAGLTPDIAVTQTSSHRALSRFELADKVEQLTGTRPEIFDTPEVALEELLLRGVPIVASGSITLAGEVKAAWLKHVAERKAIL
ncbi:MAG: bifunctional folylpolyglutamate synthase/dihydrofolate synthase [Coriobacteriales bacterium]|jgi:dihydrofolate synthase/folylpolyglutamate synthase